ncbi:hypothetical protein [Catenuloplanes japonicus]|uniref:hypothetical protein n=1 Tax=Catenuloplanes japonicus TaxID=33876 RepID=UPI0012F791C2|nr:hypothetical protein [Catenuloplanes japonicus]
MRQGDETTRRGRLGAFVFSIGTLRNQCFDTALELLRRVRHEGEADYGAVAEGAHRDLGHGVDRLAGRLGIESEEQIKDIRAYAEGTLIPSLRTYLTSRTGSDRAKHRQAIQDDLDALTATLTAQGIDPARARRAATLMSVLVERHVAYTMCDITQLAEWRSQYATQVRPSREVA